MATTKTLALLHACMLFYLCFIITIDAQATCPAVYGCQCGNNLLPNKPGMTVICDRGGLTVIPVVEMPRETRYLYIRAPPSNPNRFRFQLGTFNKFDQLEELHLTDSNALRAIGEDVFFELSRTLRVLNLTNNVIEYLIENNFRNLENLQALYLDNNFISGLNSATFNMLRQLRLLSLRNNYIRELPPAFSVGLSQLEMLDLSDNPLGTSNNPDMRGTVPESSFNYTQQLKVLNLRNTSLERLPYAELARFLPDLRQLDVGASRFCVVEDGQFNRFRALRQLGLSSMAQKCPQQFRMRPRALQGMTELQSVDLGDNHLNDLSGVLNGVTRLEALSLGGNNLQQLQREDFHDIAGTLIALDLSQNDRLALRPRMFQFLPNLQQLDLSRMGLNDATLPSELFSYPNRLKVLNLSTNAVRDFNEQLLVNLPNLEVLDLSYNMLQRVPEGLGSSSTAVSAAAAGNAANTMPSNHKQLRELYLNDNQLRDFPSNQLLALRTSTPVRVLALHNNPWACNCGVFDLYNWITTREGQDAICGTSSGRARTVAVACPTCQEPISVRNRAISALDAAHFTECRTAFTPLVNPIDGSDAGRASRIAAIIIASAIAAALLLLALLVVVWWHRNRLVSYYTREEKRTDYDESLYADTANAPTTTTVTPPSSMQQQHHHDPVTGATMYPPASTLASSGVGSHYGGVGQQQQQRASRTESHV